MKSLIEQINYVEATNYYFVPVPVDKQFKCMIFKGDVFVKYGVVLYDSFEICLEENYKIMYKHLTKKTK